MYPQQRWNIIDKKLQENNSISVNELAKELDVSVSTIRRDLLEMERKNYLIRTHGGAVSKTKRSFEPSFTEKELTNLNEKKLIGIKAAKMIEDGETIIIDAGTTNLELAKNITAKGVTVLTNSIDVIYELSTKENIEVIATGGNLRVRTRALVGNIVEDNLKNFRVDKAFIGVNGITINDGISTPNSVEAYTKMAMIKSANEIIVVADSTKFNTVSFSLISPIDSINTIITTDKVNKEIISEYRKLGISVYTAFP